MGRLYQRPLSAEAIFEDGHNGSGKTPREQATKRRLRELLKEDSGA